MIKYNRIQYLRCFAALAVVLFHCLGTGQKYFSGSTRLIMLGHGDYGVDLFFVISGFIIMTTTLHRETPWNTFLRRRLERIVPLYWLLTWTMFALMIYVYRGTSDVPRIDYMINSMLYTTWSYGKLPIIYPGWTLEYEVMFFAWVTVAIALPSRTWPTVMAALTACVCVGIGLDRMGVASPRLLFLTNPMYLEFVLGIVVAHAVVGRPLPMLSAVGLGVAFGLVIVSGPLDEWRFRVLVAGLPASIAVFGAAWFDRGRRPLSRLGRLFAHLGDASYSIYLVQVFVISLACKVLAVWTPRLPLDAAIPIVALATLLTAYAVHHGVEKPVTQWFHRRGRAMFDVERGRGPHRLVSLT